MLIDPELRALLERVLPKLEPYLAVRERTSGEIRDRLKLRKLCEAAEVDRVIEHLIEGGMVNDERFARNRIRYRLDNGYGPAYIRNDLAKLKAPGRVVDEILRELGPAPVREAAQLAALKFAKQARDPMKLVARLMRRGFSMNDLRGLEALDGLGAAVRDRATQSQRKGAQGDQE